METFSALLAICAGNSPVTGEFPAQRPGTRSFDVFFDLCLNKRLSKQSWGWWFETPSSSLWRHNNELIKLPTPGVPKRRIYMCASQFNFLPITETSPHNWKYFVFDIRRHFGGLDVNLDSHILLSFANLIFTWDIMMPSTSDRILDTTILQRIKGLFAGYFANSVIKKIYIP